MVLLLALFVVGKAQTPETLPFSENFESGIPSTWANIDHDEDGHSWVYSSSWTGHGGSGYCAGSQSYANTALTPDNWLITPAISLPSSGIPELKFWVCAQDASWAAEHYGVYIYTGSNRENVDDYTLLFEETIDANGGARTQGTWKMKTQSLEAYAGQTVYIAFRHFDVTDMFVFLLDDVSIDLLTTEPTIITSTNRVQFSPGTVGDNFENRRFNITGYNLTENVNITVPNDSPFKISADTIFSNNVSLTPNAQGRVSGDIFVSFNPTTTSYFEFPITINSEAGVNTVTAVGLTVDCSQNQTIPWYEDFSSYTDTTFTPPCWTVVSTDTFDYVSSSGTHPGYKYYTWCSTGSDYATVVGDTAHVQNEHLISPTFDLSNVEGAKDFTFGFTTHPGYDAFVNGQVSLKLNMSTDGGNTYTTIWNAHDDLDRLTSIFTSWSSVLPVTINLDTLRMNNVKFDFVYEGEAHVAGQMIIHYVQFNNFFDPRLTVTAEDSIDFFTYVGHAEPTIIPIEGRNLTSSINVATTAPYEVSINNVDYATTATIPANGGNLYVKYNPSNTSSDTTILTITSSYVDATNTYPDTTLRDTIVLAGNAYNCSVITFPITESFESEEGTVLAPNTTEYCWTAFKVNEQDPQNNIINSNDYAYDGNLSFRFSSAQYNEEEVYDQYLISPELTSDNPMLVMFNYANASVLKDETFAVGYSTTGKDIDDFTWGNDIINASNTDWQLYRNTNVPANTKYVAIHYKSNYKAYLYIDNFQIRAIPSCLFPVNVKAENTGVDYADITWTEGANETSWQMAYGIAPLDLTSATPVDAPNQGAHITGLTANTHYQIAVRAMCGSTPSEWSEIADFWTTTTPATLPYTQTFEDDDPDRDNWTLVNGNECNHFVYGNIPGSITGKAMFITKDSVNYTNSYITLSVDDTLYSNYSTVWAYRDILFPDTIVPGFLISLNWKCFGEVDYDFGELFIGNATEVTNFERDNDIPGYVDVNTAHYTPVGLTKLDRYVSTFNMTTFQESAYLIPNEGYAGKIKRLYFLWTNDSLTTNDTPLAVDNLSITIPQFANMSGLVTDANTGNIIPNAVISISSLQGFSATSTTDNTGHYIIENIVTGLYTITVTATGYQPYTTAFALSSGDNNVPFELTLEDCVIIPSGVHHTIEEDNMILSWNAITSGVLSQATSDENDNAIGGPSKFGCYHLFTPSHLNTVNGGSITSIGFYPNVSAAYASYTLCIYIGGSAANGPASVNPVYEQEVLPNQIRLNQWVDIELNTPYVIDGSQCLWIGYKVYDQSDDGRPAGVTDEGHRNGYGDIMYWQSSWTTLYSAGGGDLNYNWMIRANVVAPNLTYNVLEDGQVIASNLTDAEYIVNPFSANSCYQVVTICENGEISAPSECAVGINDVDNVASFEVYPNPAHETVTVSTTMNAQKVEVMNYLGQVIYSKNVTGNNFTLNVANYADGVYFIRLTGDEGIATQKLIKK